MVRVLGITDDRTDCECCGKTNLKRTVALEFENAGVRYFGVDCAAMAVHGRKTKANAKKVVAAADAYKRDQDYLDKAKGRRINRSMNEALLAYIATGRKMDQRAHYARGVDNVIVDMSDAVDVQWYTQRMFSFVSKFD